VASSRNRRRTKHRGNAAGMIEARGRTGRKPRADEKRSTSSRSSRPSGTSKRYDKPPTWRGSLIRALVAAAIVFAVSLLLIKKTSIAGKLVLLPIVLAIYTPMIYYMDSYMYRRAQRRRAGGR